MHAETASVRVERRERRRAAHVRDPGAGGDRASDLGDRAIGHAEEDELGLVGVEEHAALGEARAHRSTDASTPRPRL